jgi:hypothetical protein
MVLSSFLMVSVLAGLALATANEEYCVVCEAVQTVMSSNEYSVACKAVETAISNASKVYYPGGNEQLPRRLGGANA